MSLTLTAAARVHHAAVAVAAVKERPAAHTEAEERLSARLRDLLAPRLAAIEEQAAGGVPSGEAAAQLLAAQLRGIDDELLDVLLAETASVADEAIAEVERAVAAHEERSTKARGPDRAAIARAGLTETLDRARPLWEDRRLFASMMRTRDSVLARLVDRTVGALVDATAADAPAEALHAAFEQLLDAELSQLSRHAVGDVRNDAVEEAERDLGVEFHQWHTTGDGNVRPAHADVDGEIARVGQQFSNGWGRPGGLGCRCWLEPWFPPAGQQAPAGLDHFSESDLEAAA